MYSVDLNKITLDEFKKILLTAYLLPSQKVILTNLNENIEKLKNKGLSNLHDLHSLLKKKKDYSSIAEDVKIDEAYLVILNRMVNSFIVKELPLAKLEIFSNEECKTLADIGVVNTRHYYEAYIKAKQASETFLNEIITPEKMLYSLHIIDLLRINGVGVDYAKILYEMGIRSVVDYNKTSSEIILQSFKALNKTKELTKANLGITDIDYCRRFSERLDNDLAFPVNDVFPPSAT
ncbi:MAG: DUF4332 domain-containing protein [Clostridia bacterium]|nr:DUF4332 domain-containing protein [Clostridia bacterium]